MTDFTPRLVDISERLLEKAFSGETFQAIEELQKYVAEYESDGSLWAALGVSYGLSLQYEQAISALNRALVLLPGHVLSLAYMGVFLHMQGNYEQAHDLLDYKGMISEIRLHESRELEKTNDFHDELANYLRHHPSLTWQLPDKATRNGWQTGELLNDDVGIVRELHKRLRLGVQEIIHSWEDSENIDFPIKMTAWGVILKSGGHQAPHVHQAGLFSGVYYVAVPPMAGGENAGALCFPLRLPWLPQQDIKSKPFFIQPEVGKMVLFPSYFWHETVPFIGSDDRICIAFDVLPPEIFNESK